MLTCRLPDVRQGSPNTNALRSAPRRQRPDHRPTAAERARRGRARRGARLAARPRPAALEYLAAGGYADEPDAAALQRVAAHAADELRAYVDGEAERAPRDLGAALDAVAADARMLAGDVQHPARRRARDALELPAAVVDALAAATREALANVAKHARATRATVRADVARAAVVVRIEDDGAGFDPGRTPFGAGLRHSVQAALARVGGTATLAVGAGRRHAASRSPSRCPPRTATGGGRMRIDVLLVDDFPLVREGMAAALTRDPGIRVVGQAENGKEGLALAKELQPDVILLDLHMPEMGGMMTLERLHAEVPKAARAGHDGEREGGDAARRGVRRRGRLHHQAREPPGAVRGGHHRPRRRLGRSRRTWPATCCASTRRPRAARRTTCTTSSAPASSRSCGSSPWAGRTARSREEIYVSPRTVQNHLARIRDKTGLRRRSELTRWAVVHAVY